MLKVVCVVQTSERDKYYVMGFDFLPVEYRFTADGAFPVLGLSH